MLNFPDVWLNRVRTTVTTAANAPWLDGIPELDVTVTELGAGDASETNVIHVPLSTFKPDVLINNTTYPIALQAYNDAETLIQLDKYQTKIVTLSDDQIIGAAYPRVDAATRSLTDAVIEKKYAKAIHALAPNADAANTPVLPTTGGTADGRKRFVYADLVAMKAALDARGFAKEGRRFVPCSDHYNDMLLDRQNFGDAIVNMNQGTLAPRIAGFEIFPDFINNPYYLGTNKVAFAAVPGVGARQASVVFIKTNIAKKTGLTKQYFLPAAQNPTMQTNQYGIRHYFIVTPFESKEIGAIVSANA